MRQQPVTLTDDHVWIISTLSDALALNEALCLNLLLEADTIFGLQGRTREDSARLAAGVYHEERLAVIECLLLLLRATLVEFGANGGELQPYLVDFAMRLLARANAAEGGGSTLLRRLLALASAEPAAVAPGSVLEHITLSSGNTCLRADQIALEATLCAEALHCACAAVSASVHSDLPVALRVEDAMAVVQLAGKHAHALDAEAQKKASAQALSDAHARAYGRSSNEDGEPDSRRAEAEREQALRKVQTAVACQLAAVELLCPCDERGAPVGVAAEPSLRSQVATMVRSFKASAGVWQDRVNATIALAWGLASADATAPAGGAVDGEAADVIARWSGGATSPPGCFTGLSQAEEAARFAHGQRTMAHLSIHKLLVRFLLHPAGYRAVRAMRDAASAQASSEGAPEPAQSKALVDMLSLMATLYEAHPELSEHWRVHGFVENVMEDPCSVSMLSPLLRLLASLAGSNEWRGRLREWLQSRASPVSWPALFSATTEYQRRHRELEKGPQAQPAQTAGATSAVLSQAASVIPKEDQAVLMAYLALLRSLFEAAGSDEERQALAQEIVASSGTVAIMGLVDLYTCGVSPTLKASLLDALAAAALSPSLAHVVLEQLKLSGVVGAPTSSATSGLARQLNEIESAARTYPELRAFLRLVKALATSLPLYTDRGLCMSSVLPFVRDEAFLKLARREYNDPAERWEVAALCMEIFERVVAVYAPRPQDFGGTFEADLPPGLAVMNDALTGGSILHTALEILSAGGDEAAGDRTLAPLEAPRERAVQAALLLLRTVLGADAAVSRCAAHGISRGVERGVTDSARGIASNAPAAPLLTLDVVLMRAPERLAACMQYCAYAPNVAVRCAAVDIMRHLSDRVEALPLALGDGAPARRIVNGCAAAMAEAVGRPVPSADGADADVDAYHLGLRVLSLMQSAALQPAPNMLHFLLGCQCSVDGVDMPDAAAVRQLAPLLQLAELVCDTSPGVLGGGRDAHAARLAELAVQILASLATEERTRSAVLHALRQRGLVARMAASRAAAAPEAAPAALGRRTSLAIMGGVLRLAAIELHSADPEVPLQGESIASVLHALFGAAADSLGDPSALQALSSRHVALLQILELLRPAAAEVNVIGEQDAAVERILSAAEVREALADPKFKGLEPDPSAYSYGGVHARPKVDLQALTHYLSSQSHLFTDQLATGTAATPGGYPMTPGGASGAVLAAGGGSAAAVAARVALETAARNNEAADECAARATALNAWAAAVEVLVSRRIDGAGNTLKLVDMVLHACLDVLLDSSRRTEVDNDLAGSLLRVASVTMATLSAARAQSKRAASGAAAGVAAVDGRVAALSRHSPSELAAVAAGALPKLLQVMSDAAGSASSGAGSVGALCRLYASVLHTLDCAGDEAAACAAVRAAPQQALARLARDALASSEALQELALRALDACLAADAGGTTVEQVLSAGVIRRLLHGVAGAGGRAAVAALTHASAVSLRPACLLEAQLSLLLRIAISRWPASAEALLRAGALRSLAACEALGAAAGNVGSGVGGVGLEAAHAAAAAARGVGRARADRAMRRTVVFPALRLAAAVGASLPKSEDCGAQLAVLVSTHARLFALAFATAALAAARDTAEEVLADGRVERAVLEDGEELALCVAALLPLYAHAAEAGGSAAPAVSEAIAKVHNDVAALASLYCGEAAAMGEPGTRLQAACAALCASSEAGKRASGEALRAQLRRASERLAQCVRLGPAIGATDSGVASGVGGGALMSVANGGAEAVARVAASARNSLASKAANGLFAYVGGGVRPVL